MQRLNPAWRLSALPLLILLAEGAGAEICRGSDVSRPELEQLDAALPLSLPEKLQAEATHLPWGAPGRTRLLYHPDFIASYDSDRRLPIWAAYRLRAEDIVSAPRRNSFRTDPRLRADESATCADYEEPVFDRGHLVPSADMNRSPAAQALTFLLSNMAPQQARFNRGIWNRVEQHVRGWAQARGTVYVFTGSTFDRDNDGHPDGLVGTERMPPTRRVGVPSHFYKIVLHQSPMDGLDVLAVLLPHVNTTPPDAEAYLRQHLVSVDEIESRTGLDFLPGLGPLAEVLVERRVAPDLWPRH